MNEKEQLKKVKNIVFSNGDLEEAATIMARLLNDNPDNNEYLYYYAEILAKLDNENDLLEAIDIYKKLSDELGENYNVKIALIYIKLKENRKALKLLKQEKDNDNKAKYELAKFYGREGDFKQALSLCEELEKSEYFPGAMALEKTIYTKTNQLDFFKEKLLSILDTVEDKELIYEYLADIYYNEKNNALAKEYYFKLNDAKNKYVHNYRKGELYYLEKKYKEAIECFIEALRHIDKDRSTFCLCRIGYCYLKLHDLVKAKEYYLKAYEIEPSKQSILNLGKIGLLYHQKENPDKKNTEVLLDAKKILFEGTKKFPDDLYIKYEQAKVEIELGNFNFAMRIIDEILSVKKDRYTLAEKAKIYQIQKKYWYAIEIYESLIKEKEDIYIRLDLGKCYAVIGEFEKALENFDKILEITNGKDECAKIEKARLLRKIGNKDKAKEIINTVDQNVNGDYYIIEKANLYFDQGKYEEAEQLLLSAANKCSNNYRFYYSLAKIQKQTFKYDEAIESIKKANKIEPKNSNIYFLGVCYYQSKKYDEAIETLNLIKSSGDYYIESNIMLAKIYLIKGDYEKAYNTIYPIADTRGKKDAYAILITIEELFGHYDVINSYYKSFSNREREMIKSLVLNFRSKIK